MYLRTVNCFMLIINVNQKHKRSQYGNLRYLHLTSARFELQLFIETNCCLVSEIKTKTFIYNCSETIVSYCFQSYIVIYFIKRILKGYKYSTSIVTITNLVSKVRSFIHGIFQNFVNVAIVT